MCGSKQYGSHLVRHPEKKVEKIYPFAGIRTRDPDHDLENQKSKNRKTDALDRSAMIPFTLENFVLFIYKKG